MVLLILSHFPIKHGESPPPPTKCSYRGSSCVLPYISFLQLPGVCLSGCRPLLHRNWGNQNSRNPSLAGWLLSVSSAEKNACTVNPEARASGKQWQILLLFEALYPPPSLQENKGTLNSTLSSPLALSRRGCHFTKKKEIPPLTPLEMRRNEMSPLTPHTGEESPKAG